VDEGALLSMKRLLQFPAYRCDPCRERFFSVRPFRRIVPSSEPANDQKVAAEAQMDG
jgi:hypothetical protein